MDTDIQLWQWLLFGGFVITLLATDMLLLHRSEKAPTLRESAIFVAMWCAIAIGFNVYVWHWRGGQAATEFLTGYLLEWSLSMDNVFVFAVIFRFFQVPLKYQYRVLFWGILGAIVMRLAFILIGSALIARFEPIIPIFGAFLVYTAFRLAHHSADEVDPERNIVLRLARRWLPVTKKGTAQYGSTFFAREDGRWRVTPIFLVLLVVESTDVLFAVDSVPAIFGITRDAFIVFTSNIFAILGLRALYFLLVGVMDMFRYLHYGLAAVLGFIGVKMIAEYFIRHEDGGHVMPVWVSLLVIVSLLALAMLASLVADRREKNGRQ